MSEMLILIEIMYAVTCKKLSNIDREVTMIFRIMSMNKA